MQPLSNEARDLLDAVAAQTEPAKRKAEDALRLTLQTLEGFQGEFDKIERLNSEHARLSAELTAMHSYVQMPRSAEGAALTGRDALATAIANAPELDALRHAREGDLPDPVNFEVLRNDIYGGSDPATGGALRTPMAAPGIHSGGRTRLTIRDLMQKLPAKSTGIIYLRQLSETNNAGPQDGELALKPESDMVFEEVESPVVNVGHFAKTSKQILDDVAGLATYIGKGLLHGLGLKEEAQLLKGSGVGQNLEGLWTVATEATLQGAATGGASEAVWRGIHVTTPTRYDLIRLAKGDVQLAGWEPTGVLLHPTDIAAMEVQKREGGYFVQKPSEETDARGGVSEQLVAVWQLPVVPCASLEPGQFMVGDFVRGASIFERERAYVKAGYSAKDGDFVRNAITLLCETRIALAIFAPAAFVRGTF